MRRGRASRAWCGMGYDRLRGRRRASSAEQLLQSVDALLVVLFHNGDGSVEVRERDRRGPPGSTAPQQQHAASRICNCADRLLLEQPGTLEPFFKENASRWAAALQDAGADVVMTERVGTHGDPFWRDEFPLMAKWAFGD